MKIIIDLGNLREDQARDILEEIKDSLKEDFSESIEGYSIEK